MSFKVRTLENEDPVETAFLQALQRVVDGTPSQQKTRALKLSGRLSVCQQHVAWEAGKSSRTPISGDGAKWPRVRDEVERAKRYVGAAARSQPDPGERSARKELAALRAEIAALRTERRILTAERDLAFAKSTALLLLLEELKRERLVPVTSEDERLATRRAAEERYAAS